jgi:hypothetical protein
VWKYSGVVDEPFNLAGDALFFRLLINKTERRKDLQI